MGREIGDMKASGEPVSVMQGETMIAWTKGM